MWHFSVLMNYAGMLQIKQAQTITILTGQYLKKGEEERPGLYHWFSLQKITPPVKHMWLQKAWLKQNTPISFQEQISKTVSLFLFLREDW